MVACILAKNCYRGRGIAQVWVALLLCYLAPCSARSDLKGEHVAPYLRSVLPKQYLPKDHPLQTFEGTRGLPEGCITYEDRYSRGTREQSRHQIFDPNEAHPDSKYVLLVRMHYEVKWKEDLVLFLRSIMHEISEAGMHMYLLIEDSLEQSSKADDTPEKFWHSVPPPLRPIAYFYDESDIHNQYAQLHQFKLHAREYLPITWFMHRFPGYDFAWYMEYDVRYTGPSLGRFLNSALLIAVETLQRNDLNHEGPLKFLSGSVGSRSQYDESKLPENADGLPDLVFIGNGTHTFPITEDYQPRDPEHYNLTKIHHHQIQLFGLSKALGKKLHDNALEGAGGHIEEYVPSLAKESHMSVVSIPIPLFIGDSFHCCKNASEEYYEDWYASKECRQFALLHPVKLGSQLWDPQDLRT